MSEGVLNELSTICHMLKGTLTVISGYSEMLLDPSNGDICPSKLTFAGRVSSASRQMLLQLDNVSMFGHIQTSGLGVRPTAVELRPVLEEVVQAWDGAWGTVLEFTAPSGLVVEADRRALTVIVENLVSNAMRHSPTNRAARIEARLHSGRVTITVSNHGPVIATAEQPMLFQPFGRLPGHRGIGLGLYVSHHLLGQQGLELMVKSDTRRGTRFSFDCPLAPQG